MRFNICLWGAEPCMRLEDLMGLNKAAAMRCFSFQDLERNYIFQELLQSFLPLNLVLRQQNSSLLGVGLHNDYFLSKVDTEEVITICR